MDSVVLSEDIPILDVFGTDSSAWTEKLSGLRGKYYRAAVRRVEALDEKSKKAFRARMFKGFKENFSSESHGEAISKGKFRLASSLTMEEKERRSRCNSSTASRTWLNASSEVRARWSKSNSEGQRAYWERLTIEERDLRRDSTSISSKRVWEGLTSSEREAWINSFYRSYEKLSIEERLSRGSSISRTWSLKSKEERKSFSLECSKRWASLPEEVKATRIKSIIKGLEPGKLNRPESVLGIYLERNFPGEWAYNGQCQAGFVIGGKVPDFVNINGKKSVVDMFGNFYHSKEEEVSRVEYFRKFGFSCVIVWESQVYIKEELDRIFGLV